MLRTRAPLSWRASSPIPSDLHVLGLPLAFILSQDQTLHCKMFCLFTDPIINNRICKIIYSFYSIPSSLITSSPLRVSVTLHDYLSLIRTYSGLCRREPIFKNLAVSMFLTFLLRCRSGCKDATFFNACQVLFSLIFRLFFIR